jgi:hypothetical protein
LFFPFDALHTAAGLILIVDPRNIGFILALTSEHLRRSQ